MPEPDEPIPLALGRRRLGHLNPVGAAPEPVERKNGARVSGPKTWTMKSK